MTDFEWEIEKTNNKQSLCFFIVMVCCYALNVFIAFLVEDEVVSAILAIIFFVIVLVVSLIVNNLLKEKRTHTLRNIMTIALYVFCVIFGIKYYVAIFFLLLPLVFSIRYNDKKFSIVNIIVFYILLLIVFILNCFYGVEYDYNYIVLLKDITLHKNEEINELLTEEYFDKRTYFILRIKYLMVYFIGYMSAIVILGYYIIKNMRKVFNEEKFLIEKNSKEKSELEASKKIQTSMIPNVFPAFPDRKEFDIYAKMETAKYVGGDLYDFKLLDEDHLMITIADVSDKGIPAALFMVKTISCIKENSKFELSPANILSSVNNSLIEQNEENMFATAFIGIIDLKTGIMRCSNAGHLPPLVYAKGKEYNYVYLQKNKMIGIFENTKYDEIKIKLNKGDKIFLYTDGVIDARNINEEMYGEDNIKNLLNSIKDINVTEQLEKVLDTLKEYIGIRDQYDDITMLAFEYKGV